MRDNKTEFGAETGRFLVPAGPRRNHGAPHCLPAALVSQIIATRPTLALSAPRPANPALVAYAATGRAAQRRMPTGYRFTGAA